ncbi:MAG: hypothetical protein ACRDCB_04870 [Clostridium sp.]|uniref:hypothetical protein n=1 Tax=Clostridium TaxID=1485 RepID=UPI0021538161|nr:hypothetical protein [Clostridium sp. LY3-2]MCR6513982.1 hypothetical protein [Clostridium sp. LY3-2]
MQENNFIKNKTLEEKIYLVGFALGIISLFLPWVNMGFISANGFQQDGYLLLIPMLYPIITLFSNKKRNNIINIILGILNIIFSIGFMMSKNVTIFGQSINPSGAGLYIMIVATIVIGVGCFLEFKNSKKA